MNLHTEVEFVDGCEANVCYMTSSLNIDEIEMIKKYLIEVFHE